MRGTCLCGGRYAQACADSGMCVEEGMTEDIE